MAYTDSRSSAVDSSRQMSHLADRCARVEDDARRLGDQVNMLNREKASLENELRDLRRASDVVSTRTARSAEEVRRYQVEKQAADAKSEELQVVLTHLEASLKQRIEQNSQLVASLDSRFLFGCEF